MQFGVYPVRPLHCSTSIVLCIFRVQTTKTSAVQSWPDYARFDIPQTLFPWERQLWFLRPMLSSFSFLSLGFVEQTPIVPFRLCADKCMRGRNVGRVGGERPARSRATTLFSSTCLAVIHPCFSNRKKTNILPI